MNVKRITKIQLNERDIRHAFSVWPDAETRRDQTDLEEVRNIIRWYVRELTDHSISPSQKVVLNYDLDRDCFIEAELTIEE